MQFPVRGPESADALAKRRRQEAVPDQPRATHCVTASYFVLDVANTREKDDASLDLVGESREGGGRGRVVTGRHWSAVSGSAEAAEGVARVSS